MYSVGLFGYNYFVSIFNRGPMYGPCPSRVTYLLNICLSSKHSVNKLWGLCKRVSLSQYLSRIKTSFRFSRYLEYYICLRSWYSSPVLHFFSTPPPTECLLERKSHGPLLVSKKKDRRQTERIWRGWQIYEVGSGIFSRGFFKLYQLGKRVWGEGFRSIDR